MTSTHYKDYQVLAPFSVASRNNFKDTVKVLSKILATLLIDEITATFQRPFFGMNSYLLKQLKISKIMYGKGEN